MEWLKKINEEEDAYTAFEYFLNLDKGKRNVANAYKNYKKEHEQANKQIPLEWYEWSTKYEWNKRANERDEYLKSATSEYNVKEQVKDLLELRKSQKVLAKLLTATGKRAIEAAQARLMTLDPEEIQVRDLAGILKAGVSILAVGNDTMTQALALDELIQMLSEENDIDTDNFSITSSDNILEDLLDE